MTSGSKAVRQMTRTAGKKARFSAQAGRAASTRGADTRSCTARRRRTPTRSSSSGSEATLFATSACRSRDVEIGVEDGVVTLTGEVVGDKRAATSSHGSARCRESRTSPRCSTSSPSNRTTGPPADVAIALSYGTFNLVGARPRRRARAALRDGRKPSVSACSHAFRSRRRRGIQSGEGSRKRSMQ